MKRLIKIFAAAVLVLAFVNAANAQNSRQERKAKEQAAIKNMVDKNHFYFVLALSFSPVNQLECVFVSLNGRVDSGLCIKNT